PSPYVSTVDPPGLWSHPVSDGPSPGNAARKILTLHSIGARMTGTLYHRPSCTADRSGFACARGAEGTSLPRKRAAIRCQSSPRLARTARNRLRPPSSPTRRLASSPSGTELTGGGSRTLPVSFAAAARPDVGTGRADGGSTPPRGEDPGAGDGGRAWTGAASTRAVASPSPAAASAALAE